MKRFRLTLTSLAALGCAAGAADCAPAPAAANPPASASTADQARSEADLEAQLANARQQLEDAAKQVAELSAQLGRPLIERFMTLAGGGPGRAIIGVQLEEGAAGRGALVREVSPGGPAAEAGMRAGDVITAVNGTEIKGPDAAGQVVAAMREVKPDSKVTVRVVRGGTPHELTIEARPGPAYFLARGFGGPQTEGLGRLPPALLMGGPLGDMELVSLTPQLGRYFGSDKGALVVRAPPGLKLEDGDVILSIDGRQPLSGSHATRILASYQPGEKLSMHIVRMHKTMEVEATVPERAGALQLPAPPRPPLPPPSPPSPRDGQVSNTATDTAGGHPLAGV